MARILVLALCQVTQLSFFGCSPENQRFEGPAPQERLLLLFPKSEKRLILEVPVTGGDLDIGADYDGPAGSLGLHVESAGSAWEGARLAGSNMRLVACGVRARNGRLVITLRNHRSSSRMVALRVALHKSDMCTPLSPVIDEFWALRQTVPAPEPGRPEAEPSR